MLDASLSLMKSIAYVLVAATVPLTVGSACKDERAGTTSTTGVEVADPTTALDQKNNKEDLELVRAVRRRLVLDTTLSMRAKNAVVVVQDGVVTLRGDVADRVEHDLIINKVQSLPGVVRIDDRLTFHGATKPPAGERPTPQE